MSRSNDCPRCAGLMIDDYGCDTLSSASYWCRTTRCLNCGCICEALITKNRARKPELPSHPRFLNVSVTHNVEDPDDEIMSVNLGKGQLQQAYQGSRQRPYKAGYNGM